MKYKIPQPINNLLLTLKEPLATTIETKGGFSLHLESRYNFEFNVTCEAKVAALPKNTFFGKKLKKGDTIWFSYSVVSDRSFACDSDYFNPYINENYRQQFINGLGEKIDIMAVPGLISIKWVGTYTDKKGVFQHGVEGQERDMERWKAQFKFGSVQNYTFNNLLEYKGHQYWKCDYDKVFAKQSANGEIIAIGDRAILEPIDLELPREVITELGIKIPMSALKARIGDRGILVSGGAKQGFKKGDIVSFDERFIERYTFNKKDYYLVKEDRLDGIWKGGKND